MIVSFCSLLPPEQSDPNTDPAAPDSSELEF